MNNTLINMHTMQVLIKSISELMHRAIVEESRHEYNHDLNKIMETHIKLGIQVDEILKKLKDSYTKPMENDMGKMKEVSLIVADRPDYVTDEILSYLDQLKDYAHVNPVQFPVYLENDKELSTQQAIDAAAYWMHTVNSRYLPGGR